MNQVHQAMRQIAWKIRPKVSSAVLPQLARYEDLGVAIPHGELDVRVGFVVTQQDIEARLALLDQVIFERERLMFVGYGDVLDVDGLAHERAGLLIVALVRLQKIRSHPRPQVLGLADIDHLTLGVLVQVATGRGRNRPYLLNQVHSTSLVPVLSLGGLIAKCAKVLKSSQPTQKLPGRMPNFTHSAPF